MWSANINYFWYYFSWYEEIFDTASTRYIISDATVIKFEIRGRKPNISQGCRKRRLKTLYQALFNNLKLSSVTGDSHHDKNAVFSKYHLTINSPESIIANDRRSNFLYKEGMEYNVYRENDNSIKNNPKRISMILSEMNLRDMLAEPTGNVNMVLDTDTFNEIDDQFALSLAVLSPDRINLQAVTAAPFLNSRSNDACDGILCRSANYAG